MERKINSQLVRFEVDVNRLDSFVQLVYDLKLFLFEVEVLLNLQDLFHNQHVHNVLYVPIQLHFRQKLLEFLLILHAAMNKRLLDEELELFDANFLLQQIGNLLRVLLQQALQQYNELSLEIEEYAPVVLLAVLYYCLPQVNQFLDKVEEVGAAKVELVLFCRDLAHLYQKVENEDGQIKNVAPDFLLEASIGHFLKFSIVELNDNEDSIQDALGHLDEVLGHILDVVVLVQLVVHVLFHHMVVVLAQQLQE